MTFVTAGLAVAGAVSILIPILIHLLSRQRRRPIKWAAMRFLLEALRKHRRRLQLQQLLLLVVRCLILAVLGAALARPFLEAAGMLDGAGSRVVYLVIDNGLASGARTVRDGESRSVLDDSIDVAVSLVESLGPGDSVGVLTAARPSTGLVVPPSSDHRAIIELLRSLEPAEAPTDLHATFGLLRSALDELGSRGDRAVVYLLSEFRSGSARLETSLPSLSDSMSGGATIAPRLLFAPAAQNVLPNTQVVSIEPLRGLVLAEGDDSTGQISVALARSGGVLARDVTRVRLIGDRLPPIEPRVVQWAPGQAHASVEFMVNFAGSFSADRSARGDGGISLTAILDDDALAADNARHTVLLSRSRVRALLVGRRSFGLEADLDRLRAAQWFDRALEPSDRSPIDVVDVDPAALDGMDVRGVDVTIVTRPDLLNEQGWSVLGAFVRTGGLLLVSPPGDANVHPWTEQFIDAMSLPWRIDLEVTEPEVPLLLATEQPGSELLRLISADLEELSRPVIVTRLLAVDMAQTQAETVLALADGSPLVISGSPFRADADEDAPPRPGAGLVIYLAASPELAWTNLPAQPLMVPLMHELIKQGIGLIKTTQRYAVGEQPALGLGSVATALVDPRGRNISITREGRPDVPLARAGLYGIFDHGNRRLGSLAVNVDTVAGRTDPQNQAAVSEWLRSSGDWEVFAADDPAAALRTADSGAPLAGMLLVAVVALIIVETVCARRFSHALPPAQVKYSAGPEGGAGMVAAAAIAPRG